MKEENNSRDGARDVARDDTRDDSNEASLAHALRDYHHHLDIPAGDPAWQAMSQRLQKPAATNGWIRCCRIAAMIAGIMLICQLVFNAVNPALAMTRYFFKVHYGETAISVRFGNYDMDDTSGALTAPPPKEDMHARVLTAEEVAAMEKSFQEQEIPHEEQPQRHSFATIEEAEAILTGSIHAPLYLPEGMRLKNLYMYLSEDESSADAITLEYEDESGLLFFNLLQFPVSERFGSATSTSDTEAVVKEVTVNGHKGMIIIGSRQFVHLQWNTGTSSYRITGTLTEQEAMDIASSLP